MSKEINHTTAEHRSVLAELKRLQHEMGMKDDVFARKYLSFSPTTFYRLQIDEYAGDTEKNMSRAATDLENLREELAIARNIRSVEGIYTTKNMTSISNAVSVARAARTKNRAIFFLSPTGGGKTTVCNFIADKFSQPVIEATEAWRTSYLTGCAQIAQAFGSTAAMNTARRAEGAMLDVLSKDRRILIIDEGNTFGPHTANMLKLVLNKTDTVVLVAAIPFLFQRMQLAAWAESSQLVRRATTFIQLDKINVEDIRPMFARNISAKALGLVVAASNQFGLFDMAARIRDEVGDHEPTITRIESAIRKIKSLIGIAR